VELWLLRLRLVQRLVLQFPDSEFDFETLRQTAETGLRYVGGHVQAGGQLWGEWLDFEEEVESTLQDSGAEAAVVADQQVRIRQLYGRSLRLPLATSLWERYEMWEEDDSQLSSLQQLDKVGRQGWTLRQPYEEKMGALAESKGEEPELWKALGEYLSLEESQLAGKKTKGVRDSSPGTALFWRAVRAFGHTMPNLWLRQVTFLNSWAKKGEWEPTWLHLASAVCRYSGSLAVGIARVHASLNQLPAAQQHLQTVLAGQYLAQNVDELQTLHLALDEFLSGAELRQQWETQLAVCEQWNRLDLRNVMAEKLGGLIRSSDEAAFHQLWEKVLKGESSHCWRYWSQYLTQMGTDLRADEELRIGKMRSVFKRASNSVQDDLPGLFGAFRAFETQFGTPQTRLDCGCVQEKKTRQVMEQWARSQQTAAAGATQQTGDADPELERQRRTLVVKNLPFDCDETRLRALVEPFGAVEEVRLVRDKLTGKSKGFAFVQLDSREAMQAAVKVLDGVAENGRTLTARPSEGGGGGASGLLPQFTLYVSNLPYSAGEDDLRAALSAIPNALQNPIRSIRLLRDQEGRSKGGAFVDYTNSLGASVLQLDGHVKIKGRPLKMEFARSKGKKREEVLEQHRQHRREEGEEEEEGTEGQLKRQKLDETPQEVKEYTDDSKTVFVGNLPDSYVAVDVLALFAGAQQVRNLRRGRAYVDFETSEQRETALTTPVTVGDNQLTIEAPKPHVTAVMPVRLDVKPPLPPALARRLKRQKMEAAKK
jgi:RNA recognition motif-containing protein